MTKRLSESIKSGRFAQLEPYVQVALPAQLSVRVVEQLLDPLGRNISFGEHWTDRAREELAAPYGLRVMSLSPADLLVVSACEKLRNAIAHMSSHAVNELNSTLVVLDPDVDSALVRTSRVSSRGIAAYLHAQIGGERRVQAWHRRLREIADRLRS